MFPHVSADVVIATANLGLALVFWPLTVRDWMRGYCHIPLMTSIPKVVLLSILLVGLLMAELPLAAIAVGIDIVCWIILVAQRIVLGTPDLPRRRAGRRDAPIHM